MDTQTATWRTTRHAGIGFTSCTWMHDASAGRTYDAEPQVSFEWIEVAIGVPQCVIARRLLLRPGISDGKRERNAMPAHQACQRLLGRSPSEPQGYRAVVGTWKGSMAAGFRDGRTRGRRRASRWRSCRRQPGLARGRGWPSTSGIIDPLQYEPHPAFL